MNWYDLVFQLIDMRSFSNLWYWIAVAVSWSAASHRVLGVPWDMLARGMRGNGVHAADAEALAQIHARRITRIMAAAGPWITASMSFLLAALATMATVYRHEFSQAVLFIAAPMTVVLALRLRLARRLDRHSLPREALLRALAGHRRTVQIIGMASIFATAMFGMWQNMSRVLPGI